MKKRLNILVVGASNKSNPNSVKNAVDTLLEQREEQKEASTEQSSKVKVKSLSKASEKSIVEKLNRGLAIIEAKKKSAEQSTKDEGSATLSSKNYDNSSKNSKSAREKLTLLEFKKFKADPSSIKNSPKLPETLVEISIFKSAPHSPREKETSSTESVVEIASTAPSSSKGSFIKRTSKQVGSFIKHKTKLDAEDNQQVSASAPHSPREKETSSTESVVEIASTAPSSSKGSMIFTRKKEPVKDDKPQYSLRIKKAKQFLEELKKGEETKHLNSEKVENSKAKSSMDRFFSKNEAENVAKFKLSDFGKGGHFSFIKNKEAEAKKNIQLTEEELIDRDEKTMYLDDIINENGQAIKKDYELINLKKQSTTEFLEELSNKVMSMDLTEENDNSDDDIKDIETTAVVLESPNTVENKQQQVAKVAEKTADAASRKDNDHGCFAEIIADSVVLKPTAIMQRETEDEYISVSDNVHKIDWAIRFKEVVN